MNTLAHAASGINSTNATPDTSSTQPLVKIPANPAIDLNLQGLHLIEASAGTGKTWTLATLMVRLIVEGGFFTRQIIATTFTRAAAAELKTRIRKSFETYQGVLKQAIHDPMLTLQQAVEHKDWLAVHLLQTLNVDQQAHAQNLLQLALDTFDELFVGTLDSFCQKLMTEFAFDSGQYESLSISEQDAELCYQVLHQSLRQWYSQQHPRLIELLVLTGQYKDVDHFEGNIGQVLNFLSAPIEAVDAPNFDWLQYDHTLDAVRALDQSTLDGFNAFFQDNGQYKVHLHGSKIFFKHGHLLADLVNSIANHPLHYVLLLDEHDKFADLLDGFLDVESQFKAKAEDKAALAVFEQLSGLATIQQCAALRQQLKQQLEQSSQYLHVYLSQQIRQQLPQLLADRGETTFSQQMRTLAQALSYPAVSEQNQAQGQAQGQALAQHIQHRYPVALVDEFQDTNSDQDLIIAQIWRNALPTSKNCLILVGDPKQAIYGFRGGDMLTYNKASKDVLAKQGRLHALKFNHRSIAPLVRAVDTLLQRNVELGEDIQYAPVEAAGHNQRQLCWQIEGQSVQTNPKPLRWLCVQDQKNNLQQIAWQIIQLLQQSAAGQLYWQDASTTLSTGIPKNALQPHDIAVLCRANHQLDHIEAILLAAKIPVCRSARINVLASSMAIEVAALMQLMLNPLHEGYLRRVLSGLLVSQTLSDLIGLDQNADELARLHSLFVQLAEQWHQFGFLAAWQRFARQFGVWEQLATVEQAERHIVNLRHVVELVHQREQSLTGQHYLLGWLMQQIKHPSQRETELERRLSGAQGVQLMTVHKSKGLEFPIVFVGSLDKGRTDAIKLAFYEENQQRKLSFDSKNPEHAKAHRAREQAEQKRLMYVALTRASVCLYVVAPALPGVDAKGKPKAAKGLLYHWLPTNQDEWLCEHSQIETELDQCPLFLYSQHDSPPSLQARAVPTQRQYAWGLTSFSQLSRYQKASAFSGNLEASAQQTANDFTNALSGSSVANALTESATADRLLHVDEPDQPLDQTTQAQEAEHEAFCFGFPRGTQAGECLHGILERINPKHTQHWHTIFAEQMQQFAIHLDELAEKNPNMRLDNMQRWFEDIVHARLPDGASLASISNQIHEFEFHLALTSQQLDTQAIYQLLQQYGLPVAGLNPVFNARYLHGYIDLVYEHNNKYYVADYKSNSLKNSVSRNSILNSHGLTRDQHAATSYGSTALQAALDSFDNYQPDVLRHNMSSSGYWLQAVLYQVALHRYLRLRLPDYQAEQHLGGVVYLYLRGMQANTDQTGILHWPVNIDLIEQLDKILGQHEHVEQ